MAPCGREGRRRAGRVNQSAAVLMKAHVLWLVFFPRYGLRIPTCGAVRHGARASHGGHGNPPPALVGRPPAAAPMATRRCRSSGARCRCEPTLRRTGCIHSGYSAASVTIAHGGATSARRHTRRSIDRRCRRRRHRRGRPDRSVTPTGCRRPRRRGCGGNHATTTRVRAPRGVG